jgi:hypothetical protein
MRVSLLLVLLAPITCFATATQFRVASVSYDKAAAIINISGDYGGGCFQHDWDLKIHGVCSPSYPSKQTAVLFDKSMKEDYCEAIVKKHLQFDATPFIEACGKPTYLKIKSYGQYSVVLID